MKNVESGINTRSPKALNRFLRSAFRVLPALAALAVMFSLEASAQPPQRWLLVVETSRAMKDRAPSVAQVVGVLVHSGMNGQMRRGDTLGVWTFNDTVHSGRFPLQEWAPELARNRVSKIDEFLRGQKYEKQGRMDKLWPALEQLLEGSEFLTVVLISDGEKISGTPFDDRINESYRNWQPEQRKRQMPIVTLLRAQRGRITDFVVGAPPWPMEFPPLPPELVRVEPKATKPVEAPRPMLPPLILSGKKPDAPPVVKPSESIPEKVDPSAAPLTPVPPAEPATPQKAPAPVPDNKSTPEVAVAKGPAPPQSSQPAPRTDPPGAVPPVASAPTSEAPKAIAPVQSPVAVAAEPVISRRNLMIIAATLAGLLTVAIVLLVRRSRSADRVSLITRSLDREQE